MSRRFINRREAIGFLFSIEIELGKYLSQDELLKLQDIRHCIEAELEGFHEWGADASEAVVLHFSPHGKHLELMDKEELRDIYKKYHFYPSESDKEEANRQIANMLSLVNNLDSSYASNEEDKDSYFEELFDSVMEDGEDPKE